MADLPRSALRPFTVLLTFWLAGCTTLLPQPAPAPNKFDLGPLPEVVDIEVHSMGVRLQGLRAPSWLDVAEIPYRQLHRQAEAVHHYAAHAWIAPPSEMLRVRLDQMLVADGKAADSWRLEVELLSFEQVFASASEARATIMLKASLRKRGGDEGIHQRRFTSTLPVTADVHGAIEGLPRVADTALRELTEWITEVTTSHSSPPCPPAAPRESC